MYLNRLFLTVQTSDLEDAGTPDRGVVIFHVAGTDRVHWTFDRANLRRDETSHYDFRLDQLPEDEDVLGCFDSDTSNVLSYCRLGIRGANAWHIRKAFLAGHGTLFDGSNDPAPEYVALAYADSPFGWSSSDRTEGRHSFPVPLCPVPPHPEELAGELMDKLWLILWTSDRENAGTGDEIELNIYGSETKAPLIDPVYVNRGLGRGEAIWIEFDPIEPFARSDIYRATLETSGIDAWEPRSVFLWGRGPAPDPNEPNRRLIVPVVGMAEWEHYWKVVKGDGTKAILSTEPSDQGSRIVELFVFGAGAHG